MPNKAILKIRTGAGEHTIPVWPDITVWDAIQQIGVWPSGDCGGQGICGKCKVKAAGRLSALSDKENRLLSQREREAGYRLACEARICGDAEIAITDRRPAEYKTLLLQRGERYDFVPYQSPGPDGRAYGVALDIGSTTLAAVLVELVSGSIAAVRGLPNTQAAVGRDIISRISFSIDRADGKNILHKMMIRDINNLLDGLANDAGIDSSLITEMTVAANPVMLHLLLNRDIADFGRRPYQGSFTELTRVLADTIRVHMAAAGCITLLPQIGSFLGADLLSCLMVSELEPADRVLVMDLGTNGEMALKNGDRYLACSVAAGSAFEGVNIVSGMPARAGAIDRWQVERGTLRYHVIGEQPPAGLCGSALVDLLACLIELRAMDETGLLIPEAFRGSVSKTENGTQFTLVPGSETDSGQDIVFSQQDVRELQLAKGAVRAGAETLLREAGLSAVDLHEIRIAGVFGNHLNPDSLLSIGMLPAVNRDKVRNIGNAALEGALRILVKPELQNKADLLAKRVDVIQLADRSDFMERFMNGMGF